MSGGERQRGVGRDSELAEYARVRSAEARHRAMVQLGVAALLALSVVPATGRPRDVLSPIVDRCREVLERCTLVLQAAGAPFRWLPLALLIVGVMYALLDRVRLSRRVARFVRAHRWRPPHANEPIGRLAAELRCGARLRVVVGLAPNPAFTAGLLRPCIYLSETLQQRLRPEELRAVVRHEVHHLRRCDPLRFALLRFSGKALFWLPFIGLLAEDLMEDAEVMADDFAADAIRGGDPLDVAAALVKLCRANAEAHTEAAAAGVASLDGHGLLTRRVRRLANERADRRPVFRLRPALLSSAALAVIWAAAVFAPARVDAAMTMGWRDRCPHAMHGARSQCPECAHRQPEAMPDCDG